MCMCVFILVCALVCSYPLRPYEGVGFPEARIRGDCESVDVDAWNSVWVPCKFRTRSWLETHLFKPKFKYYDAGENDKNGCLSTWPLRMNCMISIRLFNTFKVCVKYVGVLFVKFMLAVFKCFELFLNQKVFSGFFPKVWPHYMGM